MVQTYKKKTRGPINKDVLKQTLPDVVTSGLSIRTASEILDNYT